MFVQGLRHTRLCFVLFFCLFFTHCSTLVSVELEKCAALGSSVGGGESSRGHYDNLGNYDGMDNMMGEKEY